jgi:hypothetical protein
MVVKILTENAEPYTVILSSLSSLSTSTVLMVEWLTLLLRIWWVLGSNLGPEIGYPD